MDWTLAAASDMRHWPIIFIALLAALLCGCASGPKPVSPKTPLLNSANRLTNTITPLGRSTLLAFNHQGLIATVKDPDPTHQPTSLYYDAKGRLTNRTDNVGTTIYNCDANDNLTSVTDTINSQPSTLNYSYDAYNRASTYTDVFGNLVQYRYDANGNVTNLVYPNGKNVYYAFDSNNHMTNVTDWSGRKTTVVYDLDGHMTSLTRPNGTYRTISYDAAGQLTNIWEQMANSLPIAWFRFNWANSGNMAWEFAAPLPHPGTVPTRTMTYDDDNRLATINGSSVTSDFDGNLTSAPLTNGAFVTQTFDARNRLITVGTTSYTSPTTNTYDALNNRIGQAYGTNATTYVVNPNAKLPQVLMRINNGVTNYYIYGAGLLYQVTETATSTNILTYHYDYRGSTIALTDGNGNITDRIEYSLYGLTTYRTGTNDTPFLFNGRYGVQSDGNGLLYMRARYYSPYICRFISADPSGFAGGLNHFAYANGNPISYLDPFGLGAVGESALSSSWMPTAPTAYEQKMQSFLTDFVNFVTLGAANDASTAFTGRDLYGNLATSQERGMSVVMLGLMFIPGEDVEAAGSRVATELADVAAASGSQSMFRVVSESEYQSLMQEGFTAPLGGGSTPIPGQAGKWFWGSQQEAEQFGPYWYGDEPYRIINVNIPSSVSPSYVQPGVDNIGTAYFFNLQDLQRATIQTIR